VVLVSGDLGRITRQKRSRTWYQNISVVRYKVFNDAVGAVLDVDVAPVDPAVLGLHGGRQEVVSCFAHCFSSRSLRCKAMSVLYGLRKVDAEILLDDCSFAEWYAVGPALYALKLFCEDS